MNILHLDSSARKDESISRKLAKDLVNNLKKDNDQVTYRDISSNIPFIAELKVLALLFLKKKETKKIKNYLNFQMN